jgi:hypothetical protein
MHNIPAIAKATMKMNGAERKAIILPLSTLTAQPALVVILFTAANYTPYTLASIAFILYDTHQNPSGNGRKVQKHPSSDLDSPHPQQRFPIEFYSAARNLRTERFLGNPPSPRLRRARLGMTGEAGLARTERNWLPT